MTSPKLDTAADILEWAHSVKADYDPLNGDYSDDPDDTKTAQYLARAVRCDACRGTGAYRKPPVKMRAVVWAIVSPDGNVAVTCPKKETLQKLYPACTVVRLYVKSGK